MAAKEYPVQILIYVSRNQADALHSMTTNVSKWARNHIEQDIKHNTQRIRSKQTISGRKPADTAPAPKRAAKETKK